MAPTETVEDIKAIKSSVQYDLLTPELKVLIELYLEGEKGVHVNELARRLQGHLSKTTIEKSIMRLDDQSLVKTRIGVVHSAGADRLARISTISGESTFKYIENLVSAIHHSLRTVK